MNDPVLQLVVLGVIALFVILRLRNVLGTRTGFEPDAKEMSVVKAKTLSEKSEDDIDDDIASVVDIDSASGRALVAIKEIEPDFSVSDFLHGARQAYEMIVMAFENGNRETLRKFLLQEVYDSFEGILRYREENGLKVDAEFIGLRDIKLVMAEFDSKTQEAEITVDFQADLISVVTDKNGNIIEGNKEKIKHQKDCWTFVRTIGSNDPNWLLEATSL